MRTSVLTVASLLTSLATADAQVNPREADPATWLRQVYDLYQRAEKNAALQTQATYELVEKRASRAFEALFEKNRACEKKSGGVCALDWDFVVNGQDDQLSQVKVGPTQIVGDKATVTVAFKNFKTPNVNVFHFVREDGVWKVDDVETRQDKEAPQSVAKLLRDFKDY